MTSDRFKDKDSVVVGEHTYGNPTVIGRGKVTIGKYCSIATGVTLLALGDHHIEWVTAYPFHTIDRWKVDKEYPRGTKRSYDITIGNDVWIGFGATLLHGAVVGDGAVIGASTVVGGNVLPYSIVTGNPAKKLRWRFDSKTTDSLLRIAWWDWPDEKVKENIPLLLAAPEEFICQHDPRQHS